MLKECSFFDYFFFGILFNVFFNYLIYKTNWEKIIYNLFQSNN